MSCLNFVVIFLMLNVLIVVPINCQIDFVPSPASQDATDGRSAVLSCGIEGPDKDNFNISWTIGGKSIKNNNRRYQRGDQLVFQPINRLLDSDEFQCVATSMVNGDVHASDPALFNIKWFHVDGIELKRPDSAADILSDMDGMVILSCNITGNPTPNNFNWSVNGSELQSQGSVKVNKKGRLVITPQLAVHDGMYTCCADYLGVQKCTPNGGGFALKVSDHRVPRLIKAPEDKVVRKGSFVTLDCVYEAEPPPKIIWRRKGGTKDIPPRSKSGQCGRRCVYPNGTLALNKIRDSAAVEYECFARQGDYKSLPKYASISLAYIEPFSEANIKKFVSAGRKFEFNCEIPPGKPDPNLEWKRLRDNMFIKGPPGHVIRLQNTLVIDNVETQDAGTYTCVALNIAGHVTKNVTLSIGSRPRFDPLSAQRVKEGTNFTWTCPVSGNPEPTVTWYKDDSIIVPIRQRIEVHGKNLLLINALLNDRGTYFCEARNELDGNSASSSMPAQLDVTERLKFWPPLNDTNVALGEPTKVNCTVAGSDRAEVTWERLDAPLGPNVTLQSAVNVQRLFFHPAASSQSGVYRCNASDRTAKISGKINIRVVRRPQIMAPPHDVAVFEGMPVLLECSTTSNERAKATWAFGGEVFSQSYSATYHDRPIVLENGSLQIATARLDDGGLYTCTYERDGLVAVASAELTVAEEPPEVDPSPPTDKTSTQMIQTIALSVSGGIAYVLATAALIIYCRRKHRRQRTDQVSHEESEVMLNGASCNGHQRANQHDDVINAGNGIPLEDLYTLKQDVKNLNYPADNIESVTIIGKGEFGDVFLSKAPGLFPGLDEDILVMVKEFRPVEDDHNRRSLSSLRSDFNTEINLLHMAGHDGIVKLLAVSSDSPDTKPTYLITEYLEWGILKLCLNGSKENQIPKFTKNNKMSMCCQLACGLDHLAKLGVRHNDVATRNCVISFQLLVKISVLGLSREGFENEYCPYQGKRLPIRWMAPEALFDGEYSFKSDVWSFAIACWEIFTLAEMPYKKMDDDELIEALKSDDPPVLPPLEGSKRISSLIKKCCQRSPRDRPEMKQIMRKLQSILASGDAPDDKSVETNALLS